MGMAKRHAEEIEARGYGDVDGALCLDHLADPALRAVLADKAIDVDCTICGRLASDRPGANAVEISDLLPEVKDAFDQYFAKAEQVLSWDQEDGDYYGGDVSGTTEALYVTCEGTFAPEHEVEIIDLLSDAFEENDWTTRGTAGSGDEIAYAWERYEELVRESSRFVFISDRESLRVGSSPAQIASFLDRLVGYVDGRLGLVRSVPEGEVFYRGRLVELRSDLEGAAEMLGPPPSRSATANRMSPAGISLFYVSGNPETAVAEIAAHGNKPKALVGTFRSCRTLAVLDLTKKPRSPSVFDKDRRHEAQLARFLDSFIRDITRPVIPDGREHIEYAPTQVLTEYLRWMPTRHLDGICLPSAQTGEATYVFFFGPDQVRDEHWREAATPQEQVWLLEGLVEEPAFVLTRGSATLYNITRRYEISESNRMAF